MTEEKSENSESTDFYIDSKGRIYKGGPAQAGECKECGKWRLLREGICLTCRGDINQYDKRCPDGIN